MKVRLFIETMRGSNGHHKQIYDELRKLFPQARITKPIKLPSKQEDVFLKYEIFIEVPMSSKTLANYLINKKRSTITADYVGAIDGTVGNEIRYHFE